MALDSDLQLRYEKYKGILKEFTLMSDIFMRNVFKKRKCTEHVLRIIMNRMELKVIDQIIQKKIGVATSEQWNCVQMAMPLS